MLPGIITTCNYIMTDNQINNKKSWLNPQLTVITASQIKGYAPKAALQNAGSLALNAGTMLEPGIFWPAQKPDAGVKQRPVAITKKTPRISLLRFASYCVLMVIMLPLFLFTGRRSAN